MSELVYSYPALTFDWLEARTFLSHKETLWARSKGFLGEGGRTSLSPELDLSLNLQGWRKEAYDKYFLLLFINLFERWFQVELPLGALSLLVRDFRYSNAVLIYDGGLPTLTAGISEYKHIQPFNVDYFHLRLKVQGRIVPYVAAAVSDGRTQVSVV